MLLPQLEPDNLYLQFVAALAVGERHDPERLRQEHRMLRAALQLAEQRGCDVAVAFCGYQILVYLGEWAAKDLSSLQAECRPSQVLGWLAQARAAHRRAQALLPIRWTCELRAMAERSKGWLLHCRQQGGRWARMTRERFDAAMSGDAAQRVQQRREPSNIRSACRSLQGSTGSSGAAAIEGVEAKEARQAGRVRL
ncbi:hypothetical protein ABPG75_004447 [Micractinium tetrahymenae]